MENQQGQPNQIQPEQEQAEPNEQDQPQEEEYSKQGQPKKRTIVLAPLTSIGMRTAKTGLAVFACLLFYELERFVVLHMGVPSESLIYQMVMDNEMRHPFYACLSAILSMQDSVHGSLKFGYYRILGTVIGAVLGLLFLILNHQVFQYKLTLLLAPLGIIILIQLCNLVKIQSATIISCTVFLLLVMVVQGESPYEYAAARLFDTFVGVFLAIGINHFVYHPKGKEQVE
ncbi:FUSC family protein [Clostridia bacterium]|nr:FUSC family protein [Clostridia bacterium]